MPFNTTDDAHSIVTVASVRLNGVVVGWLFTDRNNSRWLLRASDRSVSTKDLRWFERTFGVDAAPVVSFRGFAGLIVRAVDLRGFAGRVVTIHGCK